MWCSGVFFNGYVGVSEVNADTVQNIDGTPAAGASSIDTTDIWQILNMVLKIIYLLLWPLLVVAGLALDNTLVYASVFHLDAPLWKFWNMMKNFANFALWFMVLYAIIKSILTYSWEWWAKDEKSPLGIIKTTLIAGILIQASWFLVAATVDVSTIATYAVGGLPLSVLKNTAIGDQKILAVNSTLDLNKFEISSAGGEEFKIWYSTQHPWIAGGDQTVTLSPCRLQGSYVIWREFGDYKYKNTEKLKTITEGGENKYEGYEICVLWNNKLVMWKEDAFMEQIKTASQMGTWDPGYITHGGYQHYMNALLTMTWSEAFISGNTLLVRVSSWENILWKDFFSGTNSLTISSLIEKSKWFVGPLVTIYSSLLNFAQLTDTNVTTTSWTSGIFIIKSLVAIALFFPLIALALVLILRIWVLWLYIVASPFIILKQTFKNFLPIKWLDDYLSIKAVMWIIFAPVVTVAALSISLIFMTALVNGFSASDTNTSIGETLGITKVDDHEIGNDAISFQWILQLEFSKLPWWEAMDWFSWLMVNFFAIGLMWMIVFAAIKANKIGEGVGQKVQDFWWKFFQTLPILPMPWWGWGLGVGSLASVLNKSPERFTYNLTHEAEAKAETWVNWSGDTGTAPTTISTLQAQDFIKGGADQTSIEKAMQALWVEKENIGTTLKASTANLYEAINNLPDTTTSGEKTALIGTITALAGLEASWYKEEAKRVAEKDISAKVISGKGITDAMSESVIKPLLNTDDSKLILKTYFDNTNPPNDIPYTQVLWTKTLTIKKEMTGGVDTYIPTLS